MSRSLATTTTVQGNRPSRCELPAGLDPARLPAHVAVIMDGNGRWANQRKLPRVMGHREGVEALKRTLRLCSDWGIGALTAYAFSTENWSRPGEEVSFLMTLFERVLARELEALEREQVRMHGSAARIGTRGRSITREPDALQRRNRLPKPWKVISRD